MEKEEGEEEEEEEEGQLFNPPASEWRWEMHKAIHDLKPTEL